MIDLTYRNLISNFFVADKLIATKTERVQRGLQFVLHNIPKRDLSEKLKSAIQDKVSSVELTFSKKWRQLGSESKDDFEQYYDKWISTDLKLPPSVMSADNLQRGSTQKKKDFSELSERQRKRRVQEMGSCEVGKLLLAAALSAKDSNQSDLHYVLKQLYNDRRKAADIRRFLSEKSEKKSTN